MGLDKHHEGIYTLTMRSLRAHFDGQFIVLDEPGQLNVNEKVTVIIAEKEDNRLTDDCARLSENSFQNIWDNPLDADYDRL